MQNTSHFRCYIKLSIGGQLMVYYVGLGTRLYSALEAM